MPMALRARQWTLADLDRLPDDGNTYELIRGELLVTPPPMPEHETIVARLNLMLAPYVAEHRLGLIYTPRSVIEDPTQRAEPDLVVRPQLKKHAAWREAPIPILVVEVTSRSTRGRDLTFKRQFYLETGVPEYWIIDRMERVIRVIRPGVPDVVISDVLTWHPPAASKPVLIEVTELFAD